MRFREVHRNPILEPRSLTEARATVERDLAVFPHTRRIKRAILGLPVVLVGTDLAALAGEALIVRAGSVSIALFAATLLLARFAARQYRPRMVLSVLDELPRSLLATIAGVGMSFAVMAIVWPGQLHERELVLRAAVFVCCLLVVQTFVFAVVRSLRRRGIGGARTLIVGADRVGTSISEALVDHPELGLRPVGFADPSGLWPTDSKSLPVLVSDMDRLARAIGEHEIDTAILAFDGEGERYVDTVIMIHQTGCDILLVPSMFELHHDGPDVERVRGVPLSRLRPDPTLRPSWWVKRAIDVFVGALGLAVLSVPLALIALTILVTSGRPILFWQERVGLDGRTFRLCKFRSLRPATETESQTTWNIANDSRVDGVGRFLRKTSLDEVPQLWNILRGQMSLVGPRPERLGFVQKFSAEHDRYWARHRVPVGLTGLAQVNGLRGDTSIRDRARYDNYYIANWSLWLDIKIIILTAREVVGARGR